MADLDLALKFTLAWEGGYVNDPDDPGGRTDLGISERANPEAWADGRITPREARRFYYARYWVPVRGPQLTHQGLALCLFDYAVHSGPAEAVRSLQHALGLVRPTGYFGPVTWDLLRSRDPQEVAHLVLSRRRVMLRLLVERRPVLRKFARGWGNRLTALEKRLASG